MENTITRKQIVKTFQNEYNLLQERLKAAYAIKDQYSNVSLMNELNFFSLMKEKDSHFLLNLIYKKSKCALSLGAIAKQIAKGETILTIMEWYLTRPI